MMINKRRLGSKKEEAACEYLKANHVFIKCRNFKAFRGGEIDIVGLERGGTWLFVEVKYRSGNKAGNASEAVSHKKICNICRASDYYRVRYNIPESARVRYDVIAMDGNEIKWIKNAFDYIGKG